MNHILSTIGGSYDESKQLIRVYMIGHRNDLYQISGRKV
jgi:hypothetical protein